MADERIRVCCRVRPFNDRERGGAGCGGGDSALVVDKERKTVTLRQDPSAAFVFDGVLDSDSTQVEAFEMVGRQVTDACIQGYNACIFAYGQTGSGKTYTILGGDAPGAQMDVGSDDCGLLPRVLAYVVIWAAFLLPPPPRPQLYSNPNPCLLS